jgi:hypothetical protein
MAAWLRSAINARGIGTGIALACVFACGGVQAELLSAYFPPGVPGYGDAPGVTVLSRARPDYDSLGTRVDSFVVQPRLDQGLGYDSNVFGSASPRGSWIVGTHPSLLVNSDWSRDSLGAYLGLDDWRYLDQPSQRRTNWTASVGGTLAVGRDQLSLAVAHFSLHQDRTELDALPSDTPVAYQVDNVRAAYTIALDRLSITPSLEFSSYRYSIMTIFGAPAPQGYRDRDVMQGAVTTRYEVAPQRNLVVVIRALGVNYVEPQIGQPTRNSTGYQALVGLDDDGDAVWRYRVLVGWELRDFAASQYQSHQAPIAEASLIWSPTGLTTVTSTLTRSIEDAAQEGIAGYTYTRANVTLDHEYLRNVLLQVSAGAQRADFLQGGGQAMALLLGAGATWLINRHMRLVATYDFTDQHGSSNPTLQTTGNYVRSIGLLTLRFAL